MTNSEPASQPSTAHERPAHHAARSLLRAAMCGLARSVWCTRQKLGWRWGSDGGGRTGRGIVVLELGGPDGVAGGLGAAEPAVAVAVELPQQRLVLTVPLLVPRRQSRRCQAGGRGWPPRRDGAHLPLIVAGERVEHTARWTALAALRLRLCNRLQVLAWRARRGAAAQRAACTKETEQQQPHGTG